MANAEKKYEGPSGWSKGAAVTPVGRVSYPKLRERDTEGQYADNKHKLTLLWNKGVNLEKLNAIALEAIREAFGADATLDDVRIAVRDGDKKAAAILKKSTGLDETKKKRAERRAEQLAGKTYMTFKTKNEVVLLGANKQPLAEDQDIYAGCYARASVTAWAYERTETVKDEEVTYRAVTFYLKAVQFIRDGEPFGGSHDPPADFDDDYEDAVNTVDDLASDEIPF